MPDTLTIGSKHKCNITINVNEPVGAWDSNRCCCNCKYHKKIYGHPWVNGKSILTSLGYCCTVFLHSTVEPADGVTASQRHGLCECWELDSGFAWNSKKYKMTIEEMLVHADEGIQEIGKYRLEEKLSEEKGQT